MTSRLLGRRGDGSAAVRGWVGFYTLGLPRPMRERRQAEVAGDLADETLDAIRHGDRSVLFRQRLVRLLMGIPADLSWRFFDAPAAARLYGPAPWVPLTRWTLALTGVVAMLAGGGLAIVTLPALAGQVRPDLWPGWGPVGFAIGSAVVLAGVLGSVFWPRLGALVIVPGAIIGLFAAPWLWGSWLLAVIAGAARAYQADETVR
ncbi:MAG TPA: hypothetical protein VF364_12935 [Candidatus Limnocylindria bacterium]